MSSNESQPILTQDKNILTFWEDVVPNGLAGSEAGRVIFDKVLWMRVTVPGDKSEITHEVERSYPEEYPHPIFKKLKKNEVAYAKYGKYIEDYKARMSGGGTVEAGTPIDHWSLVDTRMAANLKFHGVYTVESLASVHDGNAANMGMGIRELRQKAIDWLTTAKDTAASMATEERNRKLQSQIDELREQYSNLAQVLDDLPEDAKKVARENLGKRGGKKAA
jgi:hypothetical protein